jgi:Carboxypeptidase regulatory-like domain
VILNVTAGNFPPYRAFLSTGAKNKMIKKLLVGATLVICAALAEMHNTASIHGNVTDPSGAVIAGAMVTISNGQLTRTVSTDESGQYQVADLPAGHYRVRVHFGGFAPYDKSNFVVTPSHETEVNAQLELREARQTVTVYE